MPTTASTISGSAMVQFISVHHPLRELAAAA